MFYRYQKSVLENTMRFILRYKLTCFVLLAVDYVSVFDFHRANPDLLNADLQYGYQRFSQKNTLNCLEPLYRCNKCKNCKTITNLFLYITLRRRRPLEIEVNFVKGGCHSKVKRRKEAMTVHNLPGKMSTLDEVGVNSWGHLGSVLPSSSHTSPSFCIRHPNG